MLSTTVNSKNRGATVSFPKGLIFLDISGRSVFSVAQPFTVEIPHEQVFLQSRWTCCPCGPSGAPQGLPILAAGHLLKLLWRTAVPASRVYPRSAGAEPWKALGSLQSWSNSSCVPLRPSRQAPAPPLAGQVDDLVAKQSHPGVDS